MPNPPSIWLRSLAFGIRWAPLAWLLGISEPFTALTAVAAGMSLLRDRPRRFPIAALSITGFMLLGIVGVLGAFARGEPTDRVVAAVFNLAVWAIGFAVWLTVRRDASREARKVLLRSIRAAGLWAAGAAVVTAFAWGLGERRITFTTPLAAALPDSVHAVMPAILTSAVKPVVFRVDWLLGEAVPRLQAFHPYPNALALAAGLALVAQLALYERDRTMSRRARFGRRVTTGLLVFTLVLTWSRAILIAFAATAAVAWLLQSAPARARTFVAALLVWLATVGMAIVVLNPSIGVETMAGVGDARSGSTATRLNLYAITWQLALERPWLGSGIKPRLESSSIPVGSHSTVLGTALKFGVFGVAIVAAWAVVLGLRSARLLVSGDRERQAIAVGVLMVLAWSLIEDLDAPIVAAVQAFTVIGLASHRDDPS